jgi:hypothetical protein
MNTSFFSSKNERYASCSFFVQWPKIQQNWSIPVLFLSSYFLKILVITNLPKIPCSQPEQHTHFDIPFYSWLNHSRFSIQFFLSAQPSDSTRSLEEPIVVEAHSFARIHSLSNTALRMFTY